MESFSVISLPLFLKLQTPFLFLGLACPREFKVLGLYLVTYSWVQIISEYLLRTRWEKNYFLHSVYHVSFWQSLFQSKECFSKQVTLTFSLLFEFDLYKYNCLNYFKITKNNSSKRRNRQNRIFLMETC